jgi:hypothetical protein
MTPAQVETLIADLALLRARMQPEVPYDPPTDGDDTQRISVEDNPYVLAKALSRGRLLLMLRNHGLGWLAFRLRPDQALAPRDYISAPRRTRT